MWLTFKKKELEVKGHAEILHFVPGPLEGVQNVVNEATDFVYEE